MVLIKNNLDMDFSMNEIPVKKENLVCAFHGDIETALIDMKKRLDILIIITVINAFLTGGTLVFKYAKLFF